MATTTDDQDGDPQAQAVEDWQEFSANLMKVAAKSQQLVQEFLLRQAAEAGPTTIDPLNIGGAFLELTGKMLTNPQALAENQLALWSDYLQLWHNTALKALGEDATPVIEPPKGDRRFRHPDWTENQLFDFVKQSYLLAAKYVHKTVTDTDGLEPDDAAKVDFYTKQFVDAVSPSNFILTNPEVLKATIDRKGENLVQGLENMLQDLERGQGQLNIKMTDMDAFQVGRNVAVTPGKVVFQNRLFQLIQYQPTTDQVYRTPLVIFPPWINKFYILDLTAEKSFVRWAADQGYTVFVVSWVNPDGSYADMTFEDYMLDGMITALDKVEEATGEREINVIGYCVAGTLLAATLAYLTATDQVDRVKSATFFTAQADFTQAGDLQIFVDEDQIETIDKLMEQKGYLDSRAMATTFNMLRSNDLIWSFVVNNYLLGKEPFPFDLLYWNSDSTNLPREMHRYYLKNMYQENNLVQPGKLKLAGVPIDLTAVKTPCYIQAGREDHIAPPQSVFKITRLFKGPIRFLLAGSGHIAGVVNPPAAKKYQHWTNSRKAASLDKWLAGAAEHPGSWWPDWHKWLSKRSGTKVAARVPGDGPLKAIEDAPGSYVKVRY